MQLKNWFLTIRGKILREKYFLWFGKNTELWNIELEEIIHQMTAA